MKHISLISCLLLSCLFSNAQDKNFTMQDAILGYHLYPKGVPQLQFAGNSSFAQQIKKDGKSAIKISGIDEKGLGNQRIYTLDDLNEILDKAKRDSVKKWPRTRWLSSSTFRYYIKGEIVKVDMANKTALKWMEYDPALMQSPDFKYEQQSVAFTHDNNLFIVSKGNTIEVTKDGTDGLVYGTSVHRSEFGITKGTYWNSTASKLAFYRMDESMVTEYPLYNLQEKPAKPKSIRYPVAGDPSHHVTVGIFDVKTQKTIYLKTGEPKEKYLTNVSWGPASKYIYIAEVNRAQNHMWLNQYNANTGEFVKTLFEEKNEKYVEPEHQLTFLKTNPNQFIWWSERDGFNHLYLYNTDGELIRQITKGKWVVTDLVGFDLKEEKVYYKSTQESPLERDLYCIKINGGKAKRLTQGSGTHSIMHTSDFAYFLDVFTSTVVPKKSMLLDANGILLSTIGEAEDPLKEYKRGQMTLGSINAADGTPLYYRLFKPVDFDANKKYPVIVYLYNGPHAQMVTNRWLGGANLWYHYLAQQGFVVFTIDGRGSAYRGFEFESAIHRNLGVLEMEDQLTGLNWLKKNSWVDGERVGIHGWSYGGFMTTNLMSKNPGIYKVGVAGGPVIDWHYYEIMYTERYMDSPEENPEGYKNANLLNYVDQLEDKLLLIHGAQDDVVLWQHSLMYLQKAISMNNTNLDYFVYPHHPHNVRGKDRLHLYEKVTEYLMRELK